MSRIFHIDAFTSQPFSGNPAAVCLLDKKASDKWMQGFAGDMNLSETAFVLQDGNELSLRWFTPTVEVDLCGHATLAAAHAIFTSGWVRNSSKLEFKTKSGVLTAEKVGEHIELNFPVDEPKAAKLSNSTLQAYGLTKAPLSVANCRLALIVEVSSESEVDKFSPDLTRMASDRLKDIIVTAKATRPGFDFVSRFFAPSLGIPEDPVTGAAHCALAPFWRQRIGRDVMKAYQASKRGGAMECELRAGRVLLRGASVTIHEGKVVCPVD